MPPKCMRGEQRKSRPGYAEVAFESLQKPPQFVCTINCACKTLKIKARVAELADAPDLGSGG